jgi:hypothetical protein
MDNLYRFKIDLLGSPAIAIRRGYGWQPSAIHFAKRSIRA